MKKLKILMLLIVSLGTLWLAFWFGQDLPFWALLPYISTVIAIEACALFNLIILVDRG